MKFYPGPQLGDRLPIPDLPGQTTAMNPPAGWGYIHGSSTPESRARLADIVTRRLAPELAAQVRQEMDAYQPKRPQQISSVPPIGTSTATCVAPLKCSVNSAEDEYELVDGRLTEG